MRYPGGKPPKYITSSKVHKFLKEYDILKDETGCIAVLWIWYVKRKETFWGGKSNVISDMNANKKLKEGLVWKGHKIDIPFVSIMDLCIWFGIEGVVKTSSTKLQIFFWSVIFQISFAVHFLNGFAVYIILMSRLPLANVHRQKSWL